MFGFFLLGGRILKRMKCTKRPLRVVMMELSPPNQVILELFHNVISDGRGGRVLDCGSRSCNVILGRVILLCSL